MLLDIIRFSNQHRALHCYLLLSLWIFLLVAGLYKFLEPSQHVKVWDVPRPENVQGYSNDLKTKRILKICNKLDDFETGSEGSVDAKGWTLRGVLVVIRHGDRGPLHHVRNISTINCGTPPNILLNTYQAYVQNMSVNGNGGWWVPGPFHGFPVLPTGESSRCELGQLTWQGIAQLLRTGQLLRTAYHRHSLSPHLTVLSTRYRRTFQSALALAFPLLGPETWGHLSPIDSPSLSFCRSECACAAADENTRKASRTDRQTLVAHPAMAHALSTIAKSILERPTTQVEADSLGLRDALLAYQCHGTTPPVLDTRKLAAVHAYAEWTARRRAADANWRNACTLRAYGMFKFIVEHLLRMASEPTPSFVLFSGHDLTLQYLAVPLGITPRFATFPYASRLVFELYRNQDLSPNGYYFKLLVNGKDVTRDVAFCRKLQVHNDTNVFCRVEDIVRFIHDDYFASLNATNFKDACFVHKDKTDDKYF